MHETEIAPRFSETDALGHIGNTILPVWFESARSSVFAAVHPAMTLDDWPLIVARYEIDFRRQIFYTATVTVKTAIDRIGNSSLSIYQQAWQNQHLAAEGRTVMVYFDYASNNSVTIPDDIRARLAGLMESGQ